MKDLFCPRCKVLMKLREDNFLHYVHECLICFTSIVTNHKTICCLKLYIDEYLIYSYPKDNYLSIHCDKNQFIIGSFLIDFENLDKFHDYIKCYHILKC